MKRTLTYALSAVLGGVVLTPAMAQDNFPDAPEVHWAYEALKNMKAAGLLVGYPDGLFRGNRPASRYEMAVALHALYQHLRSLSDGLTNQIRALDEKIARIPTGGGGTTPPTGGVTQAQLQELRTALNQTNATVNGMRAWGDDIANLKRMATTFERELASMGVDVEAMKKGLNDLAARVTALEKVKLPVDIHGTFDLVGLGGYSEDRRFGITKGGRPTGVHRSTGDPTGIGHDINIWHEGSLSLTTTNDSGPKGSATIIMGNTMAQGSGSFSSGGREAFNKTHHLEGIPFGDNNETDIWFQKFEITFDTSVLGQDMKARVGRVGYQSGGYFFKRPDTTPEYHNKLWDDGNWYFDGVVLGFNFGNVGLDIVGGRQSGRYTSDGQEINEMWAGNYGHPFEPGGDTGNNPSRPRGIGSNMNGIMVDTHLGFVFNIPIMEKGHLNLNYFMLDSDSSTTLGGSPLVMANRASVFGGELKLPIGGRVNLMAGYSQSNLSQDSDTVVDEDNAAWWLKGSFQGGDRWGVHAGYRSIDPQFFAPGSWGRVGIWTNPTDVEGFNVGGWFQLSDRTSIMANVEMLRGRETNLGGSMGLSEDDEVTSYKLRIEHKINDNWSAMLGGEFVEWDIANRGPSTTPDFVGGSPRERWYDLGFKFKFNENSWWSLMWQVSDYDSKGVFGFNPFSFDSGLERATGGVITSQLSIRY